MPKSALLIFIKERDNKYSIHVLTGSIEKVGLDKYYKIVFARMSNILNVLARLSNKFKVKVLAFSLLTTHLVESLNTIINIVRVAKNHGFITIAGGPHASGDPYGTLISLGFDYAVVGEGEKVFTRFLQSLLEGQDVEGIRGLAYRENCRVVVNGKDIVENLDEYPPYAIKHSLFNPIEITRGCPYACKYCQVSFIFGANLRHRSIDNIVYYSRILLRKGLKDLRFISPDSFSYGSTNHKVRVDALSELVEKLQTLRREGGRVYLGTFPSEVRPEHVNDDVVKLIKGKVDNKRIIVGAQSGSDRILKLIGRRHTVDDVTNAVKTLRRHGFKVDVDYIFGLPGESEEDLELTVKHMKLITSLGARVHAHVFMPLPGTPFSFSPPGTISLKIKKALFKMLGKGLVYGQWERQERVAKKIAMLRDKGIIIVSPMRIRKLNLCPSMWAM